VEPQRRWKAHLTMLYRKSLELPWSVGRADPGRGTLRIRLATSPEPRGHQVPCFRVPLTRTNVHERPTMLVPLEYSAAFLAAQ